MGQDHDLFLLGVVLLVHALHGSRLLPQPFTETSDSLAILQAVLDYPGIEVLRRDGFIDCFLIFLLDDIFKHGGVVEIHVCLSLEQAVNLFEVVVSLFDVLLDEGERALREGQGTME